MEPFRCGLQIWTSLRGSTYPYTYCMHIWMYDWKKKFKSLIQNKSLPYSIKKKQKNHFIQTLKKEVVQLVQFKN